jgi:hypothetical protein
MNGHGMTALTETKPDGTPYLSGTEWEFDIALAANRPVFVYRRTEKVLLDLDDPAFDEKVTQRRRVDAFFERFKGDGGTILRAYATSTGSHRCKSLIARTASAPIATACWSVTVGGSTRRAGRQ